MDHFFKKINRLLIFFFTNLLFIIILILVSNYSFSQRQDSISLSNRVKVLEDYQANIEKLYQISAAKLDTSLDNKIYAKVKDIDDAKKTLSLLLYVGLPTNIIAIILFYFWAIAKAKKFVIDNIEKTVEQKREEIIKLIESQEYDSRLRKKKKLLVLSPDEDSQLSIKSLIDKLKFTNVNYRIISKYQNFEDYDLIIFNDHNQPFNQELITEYLDSTNNEI